jgi:hypothetical protein
LIVVVIVVVVVVVLAGGVAPLVYGKVRNRVPKPAHAPGVGTARTLFPFVAQGLSPRALDAALRLSRAEDATLVPVFLARVSLDLPLDAPLPRQAGLAIPLQEAIEQRAARFGVPVDARIERGRTYRHALRQTIRDERYDRIVIAATTSTGAGFSAEDVAWVLDNATGEIVVLRPGTDEPLKNNGPPKTRKMSHAHPSEHRPAAAAR